MQPVIFARPRWHYQSYSDLYALIALSGYPMVYVDQIEPEADVTYILPVRNGELPPDGWQHPNARLIHWNFEWELYPPLAGVAEVWHSDKWFAAQTDARYVPCGSHPDLKAPERVEAAEPYDLAFLGYMIPRRDQIRHDLRQLGVSLSPNGAWGESRHSILTHSLAYGHIHQHEDKPGVPPLRMVVAAAYRLCVISESVADAGIFADDLMQAAYHYYAGFSRDWLRNALPMLQAHGQALHQLLCEDLTFRKSVEAAL